MCVNQYIANLLTNHLCITITLLLANLHQVCEPEKSTGLLQNLQHFCQRNNRPINLLQQKEENNKKASHKTR